MGESPGNAMWGVQVPGLELDKDLRQKQPEALMMLKTPLKSLEINPN